MPAEWFIDISASAVVAWAMGDKVHMRSSVELWPLSRSVAWEEDEASDSNASAVRWIEDGLVAVGDRAGVVRFDAFVGDEDGAVGRGDHFADQVAQPHEATGRDHDVVTVVRKREVDGGHSASKDNDSAKRCGG